MYSFKFVAEDGVTRLQDVIAAKFGSMESAAERYGRAVAGVPNLPSDGGSFKGQLDGQQKAAAGLGGALGNVNAAGLGVGAMMKTAFAVEAIRMAGSAVLQFGQQTFETLAEFQKYEAVLTNTFGSNSAAKQVLSVITQFAAQTPFAVNELTESFVKLANRGLIMNMREFGNLGDLASATGKQMDQLVEAVLDATTGEFERLKEFGIKASKQGDQVSLSFKNVTKTVANTPEAIKEAMLAFGQMDGVKGGMEAISKTVGGMRSNLSDSFEQLKLQFGRVFEPLFVGAMQVGGKVMNFISGFLGSNETKIGGFVKGIMSFGALVGEAFSRIAGGLVPVFSAFGRVLNAIFGDKDTVTLFGRAFDIVVNGIVMLLQVGAKVINWAVDLQLVYSDFVKGQMQSLGNFFGWMRDLFGRIAGFVKEYHPVAILLRTMGDLFPNLKQAILGYWQSFKDGFIKPIWDAVSGFFEALGRPLSVKAVVEGKVENKTAMGSDSFYEGLSKTPGGSKPSGAVKTPGGGGGGGGGVSLGGGTSGGARSYTINIANLVGSVNYSAATLRDTTFEQDLITTLKKALRDAELSF